jgi:mono/diheme cytochrome c family protein
MKVTALMTLVLTVSAGIAVAAGDPAAGKAVFDKTCKTCHGATGVANPNIAKMMKVDIKDLGSPEIQKMSDADFKTTITEGKGKMKPVKSVAGKDIDNVVAYVRSLKK